MNPKREAECTSQNHCGPNFACFYRCKGTEHRHPPQWQCNHVLYILQLIVSALVMSYRPWIFPPVFLLACWILGGQLLAVLFPGNLGTLWSRITLASSQGEKTQSIHSELVKGDVHERDVRKIRGSHCCLAMEEHTGQPVPHLALKGEAQLPTWGTTLRLLTLHASLRNSKGILQKWKWKTHRRWSVELCRRGRRASRIFSAGETKAFRAGTG